MSEKNIKKMAVFSCAGLGDGLVALHLAHNLALNGYQVDLFHQGRFADLQKWVVSSVRIQKYPVLDLPELLKKYEKLFLSQDLNNSGLCRLISEGKQKAPSRLVVLNPSPSKKIGAQPFYQDTFFDPGLSMVENLFLFTHRILKLPQATLESPIRRPSGLSLSQDLNRIAIHPLASKQGKCWGQEKFLLLARNLQRKGQKVFFVMDPKEKALWPQDFPALSFASLSDLAVFLAGSRLFVGGDSGVGHLASALGVPTVSLFRSYRAARLWRPGWGCNKVVVPSRLVPNLSFLRLRDRFWASLVLVSKVERAVNSVEKQLNCRSLADKSL
ncbi:MAG: glycosyltransferase family 9 protein [Parachlamydiales bacterium]|jgi:ADP-heptose:LPS heptosyltransferase